MKVFLYLRVSSEEQARHGYSLDAQYDALQAFCRDHKHVVVGVYRDEGISGRKPVFCCNKKTAVNKITAILYRRTPTVTVGLPDTCDGFHTKYLPNFKHAVIGKLFTG